MVTLKMNKQYTYRGNVLRASDGLCIHRSWQADTWAPSEKKAKSNLEYRYRRDHNLPFRVKLDGKVQKKGE